MFKLKETDASLKRQTLTYLSVQVVSLFKETNIRLPFCSDLYLSVLVVLVV